MVAGFTTGKAEDPLSTFFATQVSTLTGSLPADQRRQDYVAHNPNDPYVIDNAAPKLRMLQEEFPDLVKS